MTILMNPVPVLFMHHRIVRQHFDCLAPCSVHGFIFLRGDGEQFREFYLERNRDVGILRYYAAVLHCEKRQLCFECRGFQCVLHRRCLIRRLRRSRLIMYLGRYFTEVSFIRPYCPYFPFRWKVYHTRNDALITPNPMQNHCGTPHIYRTTNNTKSAIRPPAKMNRYCAFKPLYSTVLPIPLLMEYSAI